jgi:site-specific recombinase XerD
VREYLTPPEVARLVTAAGRIGRHGARDAALVLVMYRHGLRVSELVALQWGQVDFATATLHVRRLKRGTPAAHPIAGDELRLLRQLHRAQGDGTPFVFMSERGAPLAAATVRDVVARAGDAAGFTAQGLPVHPHMLRHSTGYYLADKGTDTRTIQGYLGHSRIENTVRYTALSAERFRRLWQD